MGYCRKCEREYHPHYKNCPVCRQAYQHKYRAKKWAVENTLTAAEIWTQDDQQGGKCYYCGEIFEGGGAFTIDHVVPMAAGGGNTAENIVIACLNCNIIKGAKSEELFRKQLAGEYVPVSKLMYQNLIRTRQRKAILAVLEHSGEWLNSNQIWAQVNDKLPNVIDDLNHLWAKGRVSRRMEKTDHLRIEFEYRAK